ncbi:MAG: DUF642 domain-containing protein, partial [Saprospiraceae bacterium]|nr:DUF642 domain-containing protein [Saprospiraceae bacterium]
NPGDAYKLTFMMAGNPNGGVPIKELTVTAADQQMTFSFEISGKSIHNMGWVSKSWTFRAIDEVTILSFAAVEVNPASNYGPAIDEVKLVKISEDEWIKSEEEKIVPMQAIGNVVVEPNNSYLPVNGFTELNLIALNTENKALSSPYEINVSLLQSELFPFIEIGQSKGNIKESGLYNTAILMNEPDIEDHKALEELPLEIGIQIEVKNPQSGVVAYDTIINLPLGITLIKGSTLGADFKPRQEPVPPEFFDPSYQISNHIDSEGNFYILFNTSLFEQDIERIKKLSERRQQIFSMDQFNFTIEWSNTSSIPLRYKLNSNEIEKLKPATKVLLQEAHGFDLLSFQEHETRIRNTIIAFVEEFPMEAKNKTELLNALNNLKFNYGSSKEWQAPSILVENGIPFIYTATNPEIYWTAEFLNTNTPSSYIAMWHAAGHILHYILVGKENHHYAYLEGNCSAGEDIWTHKINQENTHFNRAEYISFYEAGADLFLAALWKFMEDRNEPFLTQSMYARKDYLTQLETTKHAHESKRRIPGYLVSGPQSTFLIDYYYKQALGGPVPSYIDFITGLLINKRGQNVSSSLADWIKAKRIVLTEDSILAHLDSLGLHKEMEGVVLVPLDDFEKSVIKLNGVVVNDFSNIPRIEISTDSQIEILNGTFDILRIRKGMISQTRLFPESKIKVDMNYNLDYQDGHIWTQSPVSLSNNLAIVSGKDIDCYISKEEDDILIHVLGGHIQVVSDKGKKETEEVKYIKLTDNGKLKRPKDIDEVIMLGILEKVNKKYTIQDPFIIEGLSYEKMKTNFN